MARAIWTGTVGFGLVQIPVALYPAEETTELSMTLLDRRDFSPVGYERVNKTTGKEVWRAPDIRSAWNTPVLVSVPSGGSELVISIEGRLLGLDPDTGKELWHESLGTIAKASPVLADGKLYIGTENTGDAGGKFFIIRPHAERAEILDQDWLGTPEQSELIIASPIVASGFSRTIIADRVRL